MASDNVVTLPGYTRLPIPVSRMLESLAADEGITRTFVVAQRADGSVTFHSSDPDMAWAYLMAGRFMHKVAVGDFGV